MIVSYKERLTKSFWKATLIGELRATRYEYPVHGPDADRGGSPNFQIRDAGVHSSKASEGHKHFRMRIKWQHLTKLWESL